MCVDDEDARFDVHNPQALRSYMTLTRQAAPVETPAVRVTRRSFEPELVPVPAGPFLMGTSPQQVEAMLKRYDWARSSRRMGCLTKNSLSTR